jgi:methyl-accepting chemotaxis protein
VSSLAGVCNAALVAERVAHGDLTTPIDGATQDEIGDLLRSLKAMQAMNAAVETAK